MPVKKVLLAEDDPDDQIFFVDFLQKRKDLQLLPIAENGVELFELLESFHNTELPDAIILDQNMPKKNGLQTLEQLKSTSRYVHIPVMVYSTYTDEHLIKNCSEKGACAVVAKPVTEDGYHAMLDELLQCFG